mmetsp:Transcript_9855/g.17329  ORF Transcript_9855/g.17329 Transcript_9855/m.17329 type:complete len:435 (+) Transcript_9855:238-1542(+)|eukprot:CAMPEP_0184559282 /NCGR_PEP_ID=MMETSP0199_2-20130426/46350_1 /TAXON_ID=1112570 /ORGANISM="Thraustochytrium sp., Strain LLF1b" /LENGTH=434 /DNA_ID=CAMNT_0026956569 /DNA_START=148 /DNA_END=1452 /DNA_ORIENTATION=+
MDKVKAGVELLIDPDNPGELVTDRKLQTALRGECLRLANALSDRRERFPGSQPVSLLEQYMPDLAKHDWLVCEKSDGVRYLLMIYKVRFQVQDPPKSWMKYLKGKTGTCFFVNRKFEFRSVPELDAYLGEELLSRMDMSLLDGELVRDKVFDLVEQEEDPNAELIEDENGLPIQPPPVVRHVGYQTTFLIFDTLNVRGRYVGNLNLYDRLRVAQNEVLFCIRLSFMNRGMPPNPPCCLVLKSMYSKSDVGFVLDCILPESLPHENDGLIFTRVDKPYKPYTCEDILKWKPIHLNSVDFEVQVRHAKGDDGNNEMRYCDLYYADRGTPVPYGHIYIDGEDQRMLLDKYRGRNIIIECCQLEDWPQYKANLRQHQSWHEATKEMGPGWKFHRVREDKSMANNVTTLKNTLRSIQANITPERLKQELGGPGPSSSHR